MTVDELIKDLKALSKQGHGDEKVVTYFEGAFTDIGGAILYKVRKLLCGDYIEDEEGDITVIDID